MENYDLDKHVEEIKALYKKRRDLILKTMAEEFPAGTEWTHPEGGLFLWLTFPQGCSADKVFHKCIEMKVAGVTGDAFYPNGKTDRNMRINFFQYAGRENHRRCKTDGESYQRMYVIG